MLPSIEVLGMTLPLYGALWGLGLALGGMVMARRLVRNSSQPAGAVLNRLALVLLGALLGQWLLNQVLVLASGLLPGAGQAWQGRVTLPGVLAGGVAAALLLPKRSGMSQAAAFDAAGPGVALAFAVGRLGCLAAGCCEGRLVAPPFGVHLPDAHGHWAYRYPAQPLSSALELALFLGLLALERWSKDRVRQGRPGLPPGGLFLAFVAGFSLERFIMECLRQDYLPALGLLSLMHLTTAAALLGAFVLLGYFSRRQARILG